MNEAGLFSRTYRSTAFALMSAVGIAAYNGLSVAAALPDIGDSLGDVSLLPWVITIQLLTSAVAILVAGPLIDSLGVQRMFRWSGLAMIAASILAAASVNMQMLIFARGLQGIATGMVIAVTVAAAGIAFPPRLRPRAYAATSSVWGVLGVGGPAIAAVLVSTTGWRGVLLINVPVAGLALWMARNSLPGKQEGAVTSKFDLTGLVLVTFLASGALAAAAGSLMAAVVGTVIVIVSGVAYVRHAKAIPEPVLKLPHITDRRFRHVHIASFAALAGGLGVDAFLPLYVRGARGESIALAAFSVLFLAIGWSAASIVASWLQDRYSSEKVMLLGTLVVSPGAIISAVLVALEAPLPLIFGGLAIFGAGIGLMTNAGLAVLQIRAGATEMGRVGSAHHFLRSLAITYGTALTGLIVFAVIGSRIDDIEAVREVLSGDGLHIDQAAADALSAGYATAFAASAAVAVLSVIPAVALVRSTKSSA